MAGPLHGIKILDLSWVLSGPFATMILSDMGAEVIKIEKPLTGDIARGNGPFIDGESSYFFSLNRGKESITLDLKTAPGKETFIELVKKVDVVVENFVPGVMKRLGLDYEVLKQHNPRLVYAAISGFGQTGPYAQKPALDIIVQGMGGVMSITGEPDGSPMRPGVSYGDITAGLFTVIGIVSALLEREKSGQGQMLDVSMLDCQVAVLENAFTRFFATGQVPVRCGTRHPVYTPFQAFATKDGYIVVAIVGGERDQWPLFCAVIGRLDLIDDERFLDGELRTKNYGELEPMLSQVMKTKTTGEWLAELSQVDIPCGPINNIAQVADDPQIISRQMITEVPHPRLGKVKVTNLPIKFSRTAARVEKPAPDLGQDTEKILIKFLSLTKEKIEELKQAQAI
ncbi:MAG: CaiB/BaiF CoA-transferase family protein [Chloroflexota bacterium]